MEKTFTAIDEPLPGRASLDWLEGGREFWTRWYRGSERAGHRIPDASECRRRLGESMPELLTGYDAACALVGDDPLAHVVLSQVDAPPMIPSGCTIRALRHPVPALVRNYDFHPDATAAILVRSRWHERTIVGMGEGVLGYLDGVNDAGLAGAITFGGRQVHGQGFSVLMILRYLLEIAGCVADAGAVLRGLPCAWAQNLLLVDGTGASAVARLSPDRGNAFENGVAVTNHQDESEAGAGSMTRLRGAQVLTDEVDGAVAAFHRPPILGRDAAAWMQTLYTAVYRPAEGRLDLRWPGQPDWSQSIEAFSPGQRTVTLPD